MEIFITILALVGSLLGGVETTETETVHATEAVQVVEAVSSVTIDGDSITAYVG